MEAAASASTDPPTTLAERTCRRCKPAHKFVPIGARDKICAAARQRGRNRNGRNRNHNGIAAAHAAKPKRVKVTAKPKAAKAPPSLAPVLKRAATLDALQWLELGGFKLEMITTPGGTFARLS